LVVPLELHPNSTKMPNLLKLAHKKDI